MTNFTPLSSLLGGLLIGAAASLLLWGTGRRAGISGIAAGLVPPQSGDWRWRLTFLGGVLAGGLALRWLAPTALANPPGSVGALAIAGMLVGYGTRIAGGCTSGHGICGLSRLSLRSLVAVVVFVATGALVVSFTGGVR
ncbi:MAG TPA: YeeE/YedE thiosulfate transporter family protein [Polyangia bacterium]